MMNYSDVFVVILVCHECAVPEGRGGEGDREGGGEKGKKQKKQSDYFS